MRFDMNNIHTIFESAKSKNCVPSEHADKSGSKIDATLGDSDLIGLFDNICPIRGDVFASMKDAAADPKNLKLTMVKTEDLGEATKIYIEAVEFATFCEAADLNIGEAAEEILDTCKGMVPGSNDSELHVVFPSEALNKGELGSTRFGRDVRNDWAMQLLTGCRRYGIHVNSGVEDGEPVTESAYKKAMNEAEAINENFIKKIIEKIGKKNDHSKEVTFTRGQYSVYSKAISGISKKYDHVGKYLSIFSYKDICNIGYYPREGEYLVAVFDTDDRRNDKEIRSYEQGDGNHDFVEKLEKEIKSFVNELNSFIGKHAKFDYDFDGHRFELFMSVDESVSVKEAAEDVNDESIEEGFGRHGFRDVKPLRDDKDGNKKREYSNDGLELPSAPDEGLPELDLPSDPDTDLPKLDLPKAVDEAYSESKTLKGVKIYIDGPSKKIDIAIKLCNKNWSKIVNEAAEDWFNRIYRCDDDGSLKKTYPTVSAVKSHMTLDTVRYSSEEKRNNPICGSMDLSFDVDPEIDPNHFYTLYVDFDKDSNIKFDSIFDG